MADEITIGPVPYNTTYQGITISIPVTVFLRAETRGTGVDVNLRVRGDLVDLQQKIGSLVDTVALPKNNCASYNAENAVVVIWGKELLAVENRAVLRLHGRGEWWDCRENPVPNSKVVWDKTSVLGVEVSLPQIYTWPGDPIKTRILEQSFDADLPLTVTTPGGQAVKLEIGTPSINLSGLGSAIVAVANGILSIAGLDFNNVAKRMLNQAIDPSALTATIPGEIKNFNPEVVSGAFKAEDSRLSVELTLKASVPAAMVGDLLKGVLEHKQ